MTGIRNNKRSNILLQIELNGILETKQQVLSRWKKYVKELFQDQSFLFYEILAEMCFDFIETWIVHNNTTRSTGDDAATLHSNILIYIYIYIYTLLQKVKASQKSFNNSFCAVNQNLKLTILVTYIRNVHSWTTYPCIWNWYYELASTKSRSRSHSTHVTHGWNTIKTKRK